jgi:hypothetical protein
MSNISEKIQSVYNKIEERKAEISKLFSEVIDTIGESGQVSVNINGVNYTLTTSDATLSATYWVKSTDYASGGYWYSDMLFKPKSKWTHCCVAESAWDGTSTDIETLKRLKQMFDAEKAEMDTIRKVLDAYKSRNDAVTDFFGIV